MDPRLSSEANQALQSLSQVAGAPATSAQMDLRATLGALDATSCALAIADMTHPDQPIVYVNPAFETMTGYRKVDVLGKNCRFLQGECPDRQLLDKLREALRRGERFECKLRNYRKSGELFWNHLVLSPVHDTNGKLTHFVGVQTDVTRSVRPDESAERVNQQIEAKVAARTHALAQANGRLTLQNDRLTAMRELERVINSSLDLHTIFDAVLNQVMRHLAVDATAILIIAEGTEALECAAARGFKTIPKARMGVGAGDRHVGRVVADRKRVFVRSLGEELHFARGSVLRGEGIKSYLAVPVASKGKVRAVLEVFHRSELNPDQEWLNYLEIVAESAATAIENATLLSEQSRLNTDLRTSYDFTLEGWVMALDLRDHESEGHTQRVTEMALRLAACMGMTEEHLVHLRRGALLHDVGKIGVPDSILLKAGPLDPDERAVIERHPLDAYIWLSHIPYLRPALDIPYCHHEKWDGTGYPRGLKAEQIPWAARLFAIVDVWDALRSDRPYRDAWPKEKALDHIRSLSGTHFDPSVAEAFLEFIVREDEMPKLRSAG